MMSDEDAPDELVAREDGDLYVYSEEDIANISAEVLAWVREVPGVDESDALEVSDMVYELCTDGYFSHSTADDSDHKVN